MSVKPDKWIRRMALEHKMIEPFTDRQIREGVISYGVSSYGYDIRVADEFRIFTNVNSTIVDPKHFDPRSLVDYKGDTCLIPPNSFALARSIEYFRIPRNVLTICLGKSTYARCGIIVNVTPFEPEWEGFVTLEISNTTPLPAKIYANEGLCQVLFFESDEDCEVSYKDKKGSTRRKGASSCRDCSAKFPNERQVHTDLSPAVDLKPDFVQGSSMRCFGAAPQHDKPMVRVQLQMTLR
jgi:deoxycytidine triphosphate deaminase